MRRQYSEDGDVTAAVAEAASNLSPRKSRLVLADCSDRSIDVIMSSGFAEDDSSLSVEWPTNGPPGISGSNIISDHVAFLEAEACERQADACEMDELCKENAPNDTYTETYAGKACHERTVTVTVRAGEGEVIEIQDLLDEEPTQVSGGTKESPELLVEETTKEPREEPDEETTQEPEEETAQLLTPPAKKVKVDNSSEKEPVVPKNNGELENNAELENNEESDEYAKVRRDIAAVGCLLRNQPHITPSTELDRLRFWTELERGRYWTRRGPGSVLDADDDGEQNTEQQHC